MVASFIASVLVVERIYYDAINTRLFLSPFGLQ